LRGGIRRSYTPPSPNLPIKGEEPVTSYREWHIKNYLIDYVMEGSMKNRIMLGLWKYMLSVPSFVVNMKKQVAKEKLRFEAAMGFMTEDLRRVHHFSVKELPHSGKPLSPEFIARALDLPAERVVLILNDLEKHMTFLFRNRRGEVTWAYPVTVETTPHHLTFSSGEQVYAA
jgi:hypothetical protein